MFPATWSVFTKPRQALERSKLRHELGRSRAWWTVTADEGSSRSRQTEVSINNPISSTRIAAASIAFAPAAAAPSVNRYPSGHQRRSRMPARLSSRPGWVPTRSYVSARISSNWAEVTTSGASTWAIDTRAVSDISNVALPDIESVFRSVFRGFSQGCRPNGPSGSLQRAAPSAIHLPGALEWFHARTLRGGDSNSQQTD